MNSYLGITHMNGEQIVILIKLMDSVVDERNHNQTEKGALG